MADNEVNDQVPSTAAPAAAPAPAPAPPPAPVADDFDDTVEEVDDIDEQPRYIIQHLANLPPQYQTPFSTVALLYAVHWLRIAFTFLSATYNVSKRLGKGVLRSIQEEVYVFFEGMTYPYRLQDTVTTGAGVRPIEWYYNAGTKQFISGALYTASDEYAFHHLPYLSAQIKYNNLNLYDISEFLEGIRWAGEHPPTPALLLSVWSMSSGVVLNTSGFSLAVISELGEEQTIALSS